MWWIDDPDAFSLVASFVAIFGLMFMGVQIGVCLGLGGILGTYLFLGNWTAGMNMVLLQATDVTSSYTLMVIPMFVLLGSIGASSGITSDLFTAFYRWLGRVHGGVAVATIATCAAMASITGSSVAVATAMTRVALPALRSFNYSERLSLGCIAMGGTLAIMIPPSVTFVLYGIFAEQSIGRLLIAGLIPGVLTALAFAVKIVIRCKLDPTLGPKGPAFTWREKFESLYWFLPFFGIVFAVFAGILFGIWTPVESGAGGAMLVLLLAIIRRTVTFRSLIIACRDAAMVSSSIFIIIVGSLVFGQFLALNGFSERFTDWIISMEFSNFQLFSIFVLIYMVLGCLMEVTSILALTIPLVLPIVIKVGWDPIWFGVVMVLLMEIAAVTPPVGLNLYAMKATLPDINLHSVYMGAIPFWLVVVSMIFILYMFPGIALWLPGLMIGQ
ncbi:MAG: TRAP transporter large permease [Alphaproteobacteria bacterium]|nr:TRAP transporter large permease [Alphaproteobacteria bacterium]